MTAQRLEYSVDGMTCDHCVRAVQEEVGALAGVSQVVVDLTRGRVEVTGSGLSDDAVRAAIAEAGYEARGARAGRQA